MYPRLANAVANALRREGYEAQASALTTARIDRCTLEGMPELGYIYLVQQVAVKPGETLANTLIFMWDEGFNIDIRASGEVFGIELIKLDPATTVVYV